MVYYLADNELIANTSPYPSPLQNKNPQDVDLVVFTIERSDDIYTVFSSSSLSCCAIFFCRITVFNYLCISMPTVLLINGYRFFFFSNESNEPIHIHIEKAEKYVKFWIDPLCVANNYCFTSKELREISEIIDKNKILIRDKWNEHFSK